MRIYRTPSLGHAGFRNRAQQITEPESADMLVHFLTKRSGVTLSGRGWCKAIRVDHTPISVD
jgi:hypothetical protein